MKNVDITPVFQAVPTMNQRLLSNVTAAEDIYVGDTMYVLGNNYYCEGCCFQTEAEIPEPDEDYEYERWRDRQLEREEDD